MTYCETTGWRGVIQGQQAPANPQLSPAHPGTGFPVFQILADLGEFAGAQVLRVSTSDPLRADGLALRVGKRLLVLIASYSGESQRIRVETPALASATVRVIDETNVEQAMNDPAAFRREWEHRVDSNGTEFGLAPFAVLRISGMLDPAGFLSEDA